MNILRRWVLTSSFMLIVSALPAMAQDKPGNPAYDWLNGKWYVERLPEDNLNWTYRL